MLQVGDIMVWKDGKGPWGSPDRKLPSGAEHLCVYQRPAFRIIEINAPNNLCVTVQDLVGGEPLPLAKFWLEEEAVKDEYLTAVHRVRR